MKKEYREFFVEVIKMWVIPAAIYFVLFCILTYPLILRFRTHFFADMGDGLQNVWNIWWINKSVTELHQSPWFTTYLHYPQGTSLIGQTLNPFNGFLGIPLLRFLTLIETYNVIVLFAFVVGGMTAFWLSHFITKSYWNSLVAGCIFTFSQYHFTHAEGHLQLVSLEWLPLFVLCWYKLITKPTISKAVISGIVLFAVLLCDHYYFFYCVLTGVLTVIWYAVSTKDYLFFLKKKYLFVFGVFILVNLMTSGILVVSLFRMNMQDPLIGAHDSFAFSLDLLAPFIPGAHWRFASLTQWYWSRLPGDVNESSVYLGLSVVFLIIYAWSQRRSIRLDIPSFSLWYVILLFFGIMALGPALHIGGIRILTGVTPYVLLEKLFPPLKLSGCPVRMMVMVTLMASVIGAISLQKLFQQVNSKRVLLGSVLGIILLFDLLPGPIPTSQIPIPEYVNILKNLDNDDGIMIRHGTHPVALYHQTIHEKPMIDGYISRYPTSVASEKEIKLRTVRSRDYDTLLKMYNARYVLIPNEMIGNPCNAVFDAIYSDQRVTLLEIQESQSNIAAINLEKIPFTDAYIGNIDAYDGAWISGWGLIPNMNAQSSQISIILSNDAYTWQLTPCKNKRPDVSAHFDSGGLYDDSGYTAYLESYDIPTGKYKIGVLVENGDKSTFRWSDLIFEVSP